MSSSLGGAGSGGGGGVPRFGSLEELAVEVRARLAVGDFSGAMALVDANRHIIFGEGGARIVEDLEDLSPSSGGSLSSRIVVIRDVSILELFSDVPLTNPIRWRVRWVSGRGEDRVEGEAVEVFDLTRLTYTPVEGEIPPEPPDTKVILEVLEEAGYLYGKLTTPKSSTKAYFVALGFKVRDLTERVPYMVAWVGSAPWSFFERLKRKREKIPGSPRVPFVLPLAIYKSREVEDFRMEEFVSLITDMVGRGDVLENIGKALFFGSGLLNHPTAYKAAVLTLLSMTHLTPRDFREATGINTRAWINLLLIGDRGTLKSDTLRKMVELSGGSLETPDRLSVVGLVGGYVGGGIQPGVVVRISGRLLAIDELEKAQNYRKLVGILLSLMESGYVKLSLAGEERKLENLTIAYAVAMNGTMPVEDAVSPSDLLPLPLQKSVEGSEAFFDRFDLITIISRRHLPDKEEATRKVYSKERREWLKSREYRVLEIGMNKLLKVIPELKNIRITPEAEELLQEAGRILAPLGSRFGGGRGDLSPIRFALLPLRIALAIAKFWAGLKVLSGDESVGSVEVVVEREHVEEALEFIKWQILHLQNPSHTKDELESTIEGITLKDAVEKTEEYLKLQKKLEELRENGVLEEPEPRVRMLLIQDLKKHIKEPSNIEFIKNAKKRRTRALRLTIVALQYAKRWKEEVFIDALTTVISEDPSLLSTLNISKDKLEKVLSEVRSLVEDSLEELNNTGVRVGNKQYALYRKGDEIGII